MEISVSNNLIELANLFCKNNSTLYIVGGYVRNSILKLKSFDIDICANLHTDEVVKICENTIFKTSLINKKLGTILIYTNNEQYEYTTFRKESYGKANKHTPSAVSFVDDVLIDASRRDFTINSIYYNIITHEFFDYYNGLLDIKNKTLKTIKTPPEVFEDDGLRLLRLIRFSIELGFDIDKKTLACAKKFNFKLKGISKERILNELKQICVADLKYKIKSTKNIFLLLNYLNIYKYIFNQTFANFKTPKSNYFYKMFFKVNEEYRYLTFCLSILYEKFKKQSPNKNGIYYFVSTCFGNSGLKDSNKSVQDICNAFYLFNLIYYKQDVITCSAYLNCNNEIKKYLKAICEEKCNLIEKNITLLKSNNIPLNIKELDINISDLMDLQINKKYYTVILNELLNQCMNYKIANQKSELIEYATNFYNKYK